MEVKAKSISAEFLKMPQGKMYPVHSCYAHGFNLLAEGSLCFAGNKHDEPLPYGILLKEEDIKRIQGNVCPEKTVFYLDQTGNWLLSGRLAISLEGAQIFTSRYVTGGRTNRQIDINDVLGFAGKEMTGLGGTIEDAVIGRCKDTEALAGCFESSNGEKIHPILKKWVGYGPGLTPSGDDFLLGILFADQMFSFLGDTFKTELVKMADTAYTTTVSVNQYFCAFQALFSGSFLKFAEGWRDGSTIRMKRSIERLLRFGHTSGRDMTAGLWTGIRFACASDR